MPYIYKITNKINGKMYIGKTVRTIEERWKEHLRDINRRSFEKRPLYNAMNKYGSENFYIEQIEEVKDVNNLNDRECFWIETLGTFKNGYNATKGGDGTVYIDRQLVIKTYQEVQNCREVARLLNIYDTTVRKILKENNVKILSAQEVLKKKGKFVMMLSLQNESMRNFSSLADAVRFLKENNFIKGNNLKGPKKHIADVCNGKRKTAYKHKWKFL